MKHPTLTKTGRERVNCAGLCRAKGWVVGDIIRCQSTERSVPPSMAAEVMAHPERHLSHFKITAIGDTSILVRSIGRDRTRLGREVQWSRRLLDYVLTKETP